MQEISNSVRQRLRARPQPQAHPDADVLSAFVEQALPTAERQQVVLHLSECSHCREVVSLSLPEPQVQVAAQQIVQPVPMRSRFWIPAFRWGGAAAMIAIAAALVVEKPWQKPPSHHDQLAQYSPQPAPPTEKEKTATTSNPAADLAPSASTVEARVEAKQDESAATRARVAKGPEKAADKPTAPSKSLGVVAGVSGGALLSAPPPRRVAAAPIAGSELSAANQSAYSYKEASQDYLNTNMLQKEKANESGTFVSADAASALPSAPIPQNTNGERAAGQTKPAFPAVTLDNVTRSAFAVNITPPNTTTTTGPTDVTTLKTSKGLFKIPRKVGGAVVQGIERAGAAGAAQPPSVSSGFSSAAAMARPSFKVADSGSEAKAEARAQFHWRVINGTLMKSSDETQWHEAYPQDSELQFKVVLAEGHQVWAGGNNATLIHSWNAGVNWETLKVPDSASGDITAITVDDGWQVKTSNGQTFVSQDHGKTWVPLNQEPK